MNSDPPLKRWLHVLLGLAAFFLCLLWLSEGHTFEAAIVLIVSADSLIGFLFKSEEH
jgi:hypothetical protein